MKNNSKKLIFAPKHINSIKISFVLKFLKYIIYLIVSFLSITALIEEDEIVVLFSEDEITLIETNYNADFSEIPENDFVQHIRRHSANKQEAYLRFSSENPANFIESILESKNISNYFLSYSIKISKEKKYLHLFNLY